MCSARWRQTQKRRSPLAASRQTCPRHSSSALPRGGPSERPAGGPPEGRVPVKAVGVGAVVAPSHSLLSPVFANHFHLHEDPRLARILGGENAANYEQRN